MTEQPMTAKEISWLSFNGRVLQEAADESNSLAERIKFLGIYSSNLDEFFRVRVATLKRLSQLGKKHIKYIDDDPLTVLKKVKQITSEQGLLFHKIFDNIMLELEKKNVFILTEDKLDTEQGNFVRKYFHRKVQPQIFPIMIHRSYKMPELKDQSIYLAAELSDTKHPSRLKQYSLIEIPGTVSRFLQLPDKDNNKYIMIIDDVIRFGLKDIYSIFAFDTFRTFDFKITRDAELDFDDDVSISYVDKIQKSLEDRSKGTPVRIAYDKTMPQEMMDFFIKKIKLSDMDTIMPGGRYHNFKDFMAFPRILPKEEKRIPLNLLHKDLAYKRSILSVLRKKEILLHFPYHNYDHFIDLLREASIDPKVQSIKMTLYRVAENSSVVNALINAKKNRKDVTVLFELQARFDEENNLFWANKLRIEGVKVLFGVEGLKVHSKLCLITRKEKASINNYAVIGTGNFNEETGRLYTDVYYLTSNKNISSEVDKLFDFFEQNYKVRNFDHLVISPFSTRQWFNSKIQQELANKKAGLPAGIKLKLNNLSDKESIQGLYEASQAGVKIKIIGRSMFSLQTGIKGISENIEAISIVDTFLEHSRIFIFTNGGETEAFISSADLLPKNLDRRIEVTCPIHDKQLKKELLDLFEIEWKGNVKSRILDKDLSNHYKEINPLKEYRAQEEKGLYLEKLHRLTSR